MPGEVLNGLERVAGGLIRLPVNGWNVAVSTFTDAPRDPEGPMSVVGVGRISGEVASTDQLELREKTATLVGLVGSVNLALFAFNLIPLLPLPATGSRPYLVLITLLSAALLLAVVVRNFRR